jgi:hypothetical protein
LATGEYLYESELDNKRFDQSATVAVYALAVERELKNRVTDRMVEMVAESPAEYGTEVLLSGYRCGEIDLKRLRRGLEIGRVIGVLELLKQEGGKGNKLLRDYHEAIEDPELKAWFRDDLPRELNRVNRVRIKGVHPFEVTRKDVGSMRGFILGKGKHPGILSNLARL